MAGIRSGTPGDLIDVPDTCVAEPHPDLAGGDIEVVVAECMPEGVAILFIQRIQALALQANVLDTFFDLDLRQAP